MKPLTRRRLRFLAGFVAFFTALWFLWGTWVVYPLKVFVVFLHEISHGVVAVATGGTIQRILLTSNQGGVCVCPGGNAFLTLSAGYLGSLGWGALLVTAARARRRRASIVVGAIGLAVLVLTALYVRSLFGIGFGFLFGAALVAAGRVLKPGANSALLTALGLTSCLYAILDIKSDILDRPEAISDARMLAELTGVPTLLWGTVWITLAILASALLFRKGYQSA
ncbi:MAG: M50 family metallopeptidase [Gemmatimonadetes bacterium]|nr:M50 family metallopeptidase [Gemmatimonadota bacterium]